MEERKETRGRKTQLEQTAKRVYINTKNNLIYKKQKGIISEEEYIRLFAEAKINLIKSQKEGSTNDTATTTTQEREREI